MAGCGSTRRPQSVYLLPVTVLLIASCRGLGDEGTKAMFRSNARHTAFYRTKGVSKFHNIKWKFKSGNGISSAPAVVNGRVYFGNWNGHLFALDEKSGKELWRFRAPKNPHYFLNTMQSPAVVDGTVYIPAFDGKMYAIDTVSGKKKWDFQVQRPRRGIAGAPTVVGDRIHFVSHAGALYALDLKTGKGGSRYRAPALVKSSPTIANGLAVFSCYDNHLHAVDLKTGKEKWKVAGFAKAHLHPAIANGIVYVGAGIAYQGKRRGFYALDLKTGKELWSAPGGGGSPAIAYGCAYVCSRNGLFCYDLKKRKQKWVFKKVKGAYVYMGPGVADGVVYATVGSTLYAVDAKTGDQKWTFTADSRILPAPVVANGVVYIATTKGILYALQ